MLDEIDTQRLILRPFEVFDAEATFGWLRDPVVMRFTPAGADKSIEETKARLAGYVEHQKAHGFSKWLILDAYSHCRYRLLQKFLFGIVIAGEFSPLTVS
jgi:RimJ/RimL family protein N-acetyltransferase